MHQLRRTRCIDDLRRRRQANLQLRRCEPPQRGRVQSVAQCRQPYQMRTSAERCTVTCLETDRRTGSIQALSLPFHQRTNDLSRAKAERVRRFIH